MLWPKTEGRRRGRQRMRWLDSITKSMDVSLSNSRSWWWTGRPGVLRSIGSQRVGHDWATELNWTTLMAESEEELKESLDEGERGEWKSWLKTQHSKTKITVSGLITSWQIKGEKVEAVTYFNFLGSKITERWLQPWNSKTLAPWKASYDKPRQCINKPRQHIKKQRHHFADQGQSKLWFCQ